MFSDKLNLELEKLGYKSVQQKANACGLSYEYMRQVLKGKPLSEERIFEIGKKLSLSEKVISELILLKTQDRAKNPETKGILSKILEESFGGGEGGGSGFEDGSGFGGGAGSGLDDGSGDETNIPDNVKFLPKEFKVPVYSSIKAGSGELGITDGNVDGHIYISKEYIKQKVFCLRISGDSMKDRIFDGEVGIFKPINGEVVNDRGIYAIEVEGWASWVVKHIKHDPSGIVQLISANSAYPVKEIDPNVSNVIVRGRLIESRRLF